MYLTTRNKIKTSYKENQIFAPSIHSTIYNFSSWP